MQKAVLYAMLAPILYALANVILEYKFSKFNNLSLMVIYGTVIVTLAIITRTIVRGTDPAFNFPNGSELYLLLALGAIFFLADYFFIGAYTNGGDLLTITILTILFPVFASIFKFLGSLIISDMVSTPPNIMQISGYILAAIAVLLVVKGSPHL
jgi:drug/metabolite transporter (DMT)-like permease